MPRTREVEDSPLDLSVKKVSNSSQHNSIASTEKLITQSSIIQDYHRTLSRLSEGQHFNHSLPFNYPGTNFPLINPYSTSFLSLFQHLFGNQRPTQLSTSTSHKNLSHSSPPLVSIPFCSSTQNIAYGIGEEKDDETDESGNGSGGSDEYKAQSCERKKITRPLTGRYVRNGTGAAPSTLIKLREMIKEKKKLGPKTSQGPKSRGTSRKRPLVKRR